MWLNSLQLRRFAEDCDARGVAMAESNHIIAGINGFVTDCGSCHWPCWLDGELRDDDACVDAE